MVLPWGFETCTKRAMRQSRSRAAYRRWRKGRLSPYKGPVNHESRQMNPANLPFDSEAMLQGLRTWVECESPTWDAAAVEPHARTRRARHGDHGRLHRTHRGPTGVRRLRPRPLPASQTGRARHPDRGTFRHRASRRHPGEIAVPPRRQQVLRPRHLRYERRQLPVAGSDPAIGARGVHDAAADHGAVHARRGSRHALGARPDRGGGRAQQICAGAGARPRQQRRRHRALCDRALQPGGHRQAEPCRRHALLRPLRDPRDGAADHRHRRHDHRRTAPSASASCMAGNGSIASRPHAPAKR